MEEEKKYTPVSRVIQTVDNLIAIIEDDQKVDVLKDIRGLLIIAELMERTCIEKAYFDGREYFKKGLTENKQPYEPEQYYESIYSGRK